MVCFVFGNIPPTCFINGSGSLCIYMVASQAWNGQCGGLYSMDGAQWAWSKTKLTERHTRGQPQRLCQGQERKGKRWWWKCRRQEGPKRWRRGQKKLGSKGAIARDAAVQRADEKTKSKTIRANKKAKTRYKKIAKSSKRG
ncbi:hypothetical protein LY78DRAFT_39622 [Colletotrichum sublineola]|nr:hypothetical protein LY78DRAFT_39622 [Colletotrichum sublineola]